MTGPRHHHRAARPAARLVRALRAGDEAAARVALAEVALLLRRPATGAPLHRIAYALGEGGTWSDEELAAVGTCSVAEARECRRHVEGVAS